MDRARQIGSNARAMQTREHEYLVCLPDGRGVKVRAYGPDDARRLARRQFNGQIHQRNLPKGTQILEVKIRRACTEE